MIKEYFRPVSIQEALTLLEKSENNLPFGGGSTLSKYQDDCSVIDLQSLGLDQIVEKEDQISIGATVTLERLLDHFSNTPAFKTAIQIEASKNQREQYTIAGVVCSSTGRSPLLTLLSSLDLKMKWQPGDINIPIGDWLAQKESWKQRRLISEFLLENSPAAFFDSVGRSPLDQPVICLAVTCWPSRRLRVVAGGFGSIPTTILDGNLEDDVNSALAIGLKQASDEWASAEYRINAAQKLAARMLAQLKSTAGTA